MRKICFPNSTGCLFGTSDVGAARSLHARTYMMRNDWQNMYKAASDVMGKGIYNLDTPYDKIFTDEERTAVVRCLSCSACLRAPCRKVIR